MVPTADIDFVCIVAAEVADAAGIPVVVVVDRRKQSSAAAAAVGSVVDEQGSYPSAKQPHHPPQRVPHPLNSSQQSGSRET